MVRKVAISINTSWNIYNFRSGLLQALTDNGNSVVAFAPMDDYSPRLPEVGTRHVPLPMDNKGVSPWRDMLLFVRYLTLFWRERPDIFLGFTIKPNIYGSIAAGIFRIPVINNVSGLGTAFITNSWLTRLVRLLYRLAFIFSHRVFFQNPDDRQLFVDAAIVAHTKTSLLPGSGIDLGKFRPLQSPSCRKIDFLLVGRLLFDKGIREFVDAARIVKSTRPEARFALLGFLAVENRTAVSREMVDRWVQEEVVEYFGSTDDVRPVIAKSACVVLPSYREGTPRSLLEAAAMGKPLIATDVPGCREVVIDGHNGLLCPVGDAHGLAKQMLAFLDLTAAQRDRMGRASRRLVESKFDERIVIDAYLKAIEQALSERTARAPR